MPMGVHVNRIASDKSDAIIKQAVRYHVYMVGY